MKLHEYQSKTKEGGYCIGGGGGVMFLSCIHTSAVFRYFYDLTTTWIKKADGVLFATGEPKFPDKLKYLYPKVVDSWFIHQYFIFINNPHQCYSSLLPSKLLSSSYPLEEEYLSI